MITEYDLKTLTSKYDVAVTGGQAWCMDIDPSKTRIAVGTEGGYINTFTITDDYLLYEKMFDKQKGRILCIKWDKTGEMLFTGSPDTVRVWNSLTGHAIHKMLTSREQNKKETIVWCLGVTSDNHIVSGDSRGMLSIWDPILGVLIESHDTHIADILALTVSNDSRMIYSAGVDPIVRSFSRVVLKSTGRPRWVKGIERKIHVHDVRALLENDGKLYSAGVDGYLAQSSYPPKKLFKYPPILSTPCVTICKKSRCIVLRYVNYLELWRLGATDNNGEEKKPGTLYQLDDTPIKLLKLQTKRDETIISYAVTNDSKIIAYSTDTHVRIYNFDVVDSDASLVKNESDICMERIQQMIFSPSGKIFVAINFVDGRNLISVFKVVKKMFIKQATFDTREIKIDCIAIVCFSEDNKFFICADRIGGIVVYNVDEEFFGDKPRYWMLPRYLGATTAMTVQNSTLNLVIVYSDHKVILFLFVNLRYWCFFLRMFIDGLIFFFFLKVVEYNLMRRQYTEFSNQLQSRIPSQWLARPYPITNITFDEGNDNIIILHDDTTVYVINKNKDCTERSMKIQKSNHTEDDSNSVSSFHEQHNFQVVKKYKVKFFFFFVI